MCFFFCYRACLLHWLMGSLPFLGAGIKTHALKSSVHSEHAELLQSKEPHLGVNTIQATQQGKHAFLYIHSSTSIPLYLSHLSILQLALNV